MSRLLLEICPDESAANGAALDLPPILICPHDGQDVIAFEATLGGKPLILRLKDGVYAVENPTDARQAVMGLGEWHIAEGWKLRVTQGVSMDANLSVATDDPTWAKPEIHVTTFDDTQTRRSRAALPTEEGSELIAGRDASKANLVIEDEYVSRAHLRFFVRAGKRLVEDMGSKWGTKLNGQPLTDPRPLKHGDEIRLGKTCINYICYMDIVPEPAPQAELVPAEPATPVETAGRKIPPVVSPAAKTVEPAKPAEKTATSPAVKGAKETAAINKPSAKPIEKKPSPEKSAPPAGTLPETPPTAESLPPVVPQATAAKAPTPGGKETKPPEKPPMTTPVALKPAVSADPAAGAAAPAVGPAMEPPRSSVIWVLGAALVIIATLAGVGYLGYQLFVRGH